MGTSDPSELEEVQKVTDEVVIMADKTRNPVTVSVWDGDQMVHEPVASLQMSDLVWWAEGYKRAKNKYQEDE